MHIETFLTDKDMTIPCQVDIPEHGSPQQVVLGVHGFGGSSRDDIQCSLAEEMNLFSCAVVRFDFPCHGDSEVEEFTLDGCIRSLLAAARFAMGCFSDVGHLCVFATGFGAYVTLSALEQLHEIADDLRLVVQTPSVQMHRTLLSMIHMSRETFRSLDKYALPTEKPFTIPYSFYLELEENNVMNSHDMPMLILHGEKDSYIASEDIRNFRRINEEAKLVIIPGASHRFLEEGAWDMVLDLTRDWFEFRQVLLMDWE